jgi:hypothetical protein
VDDGAEVEDDDDSDEVDDDTVAELPERESVR